LGRLLARRGDPEAASLLASAWSRAQSSRTLLGLAYAGLARVEWAWLVDDPDAAEDVAVVLLPRVSHPGGAWFRGELLRYLSRAGFEPADAAGIPAAWSAGLSGEWRAASSLWRRAGDPYESALELALSREPDAIADGLEILDRLGASPAADLARAGLRERGARVPRGPNAATRGNPAGLTRRQLAVLDLLREGLTNAEIADRLVLSVRTVDHHVAAILLKLGVKSRHEAAAVDLE
jgi:DNA-binding CsgD family transcriptional regulator